MNPSFQARRLVQSARFRVDRMSTTRTKASTSVSNGGRLISLSLHRVHNLWAISLGLRRGPLFVQDTSVHVFLFERWHMLDRRPPSHLGKFSRRKTHLKEPWAELLFGLDSEETRRLPWARISFPLRKLADHLGLTRSRASFTVPALFAWRKRVIGFVFRMLS